MDTRERREGRNAFYPGGPCYTLCPYPQGSEERFEWIVGWEQARLRNQPPTVETAMRKLRMAGPGTELAYAVKELIEAILDGRS